jgi:tetratricopeptide (TPR) repeat protein
MKNILFTLVILFTYYANTQNTISYIDKEDIYENLSSNNDAEAYSKNVELLSKISPNDSSYCDILISKSYFLLNSEQYDEALKTINNGLALDCSNSNLSLYINKGLTFTLMEKYDKAIDVYHTALKTYPKNAELWCNLGIALEASSKTTEAIKAYEKAITLKPLYPLPHLKLGDICYKQERISQALMCFNTYLILVIDEDNAFEVLKALNTIASSKNENKAKPNFSISKDDDAFDELDLIITNKIALNKKYKTGQKINIPLVKQNHILLEQLKTFELGEGFWSKKYVPLYQWIANNNLFEDFTYTICYSIENEKYSKIVKNKEKNIVAFLSKFFTELAS